MIIDLFKIIKIIIKKNRGLGFGVWGLGFGVWGLGWLPHR
jgi:hypothetical protein